MRSTHKTRSHGPSLGILFPKTMNTIQNAITGLLGFALAAAALVWAILSSGRARVEALDEADGATRDSRGQ